MFGTGTTTTDVVVIGGGQAGLAMSHCLTRRGVDHVVLERGDTGNSWRTQRWDSLRLLTPNWLSRLPGWTYGGDDPDGYMTALEVATHLDGYRRSFDAPVRHDTSVSDIESTGSVHRLATDNGEWTARAVVLATGACSDPRIPAIANGMPERLDHVSPIHYRHPVHQLEAGGVLVVGASASGLQIADELSRAGRDVTLAVGEHVRLPRTYRGMDIHWWMDAVGQLDERYDEVPDIGRARRLPSLQLVGTPERRDLDLNAVASNGVRLVGRLVGCSGHQAQFSGSFANMCVSADLEQGRLLDLCDEYATEHRLDGQLGEPLAAHPHQGRAACAGGRPRSDRHRGVGHRVPADLSLARSATTRSQRATRPRRWGPPRRRFVRARTAVPAASQVEFLDGVGPDADDLATHLTDHLAATARRV